MDSAASPNRPRPSRGEVDPAALQLIERYGSQILGTARRYSTNLDDAEDAYQRALEILLTKAPTTAEQELLPWIKTVVKHEAFAIRRQRDRTPLSDDGEIDGGPAHSTTDEQAERYERLRLGAEAMRSLKPQEVRAMLLKAEGLSYKEICEVTGWTYTKVNRCLTEGRASFLKRVRGIESGEECERVRPLLSLLADGEATAENMSALRPHLRGCLACRAALKEYRGAPASVAALVPPAAVAAEHESGAGAWHTLVEWFHERGMTIGMKLQGGAHQVAELGSAKKIAAVAASAAIAGGGTAAVQSADLPVPGTGSGERVVEKDPEPKAEPEPEAPQAAPEVSRPDPPATTTAPASKPQPEPEPEPAPEPAQSEFAPSPAQAAPTAEPAPAPKSAAPRPATPRSTGSDSGGSEFGP